MATTTSPIAISEDEKAEDFQNPFEEKMGQLVITPNGQRRT
jgi:hypothetical protein